MNITQGYDYSTPLRNAGRQASQQPATPADPQQPPQITEEDVKKALAQALGAFFGVQIDLAEDPRIKAIEDKLTQLQQNGYKAEPAEAPDIQKSHDYGFESLVRFKEPKNVTVSFRKPEDLDTFVAIAGGRAGSEIDAARNKLRQFELGGDSFLFPRGEGNMMRPGPDWLRTDANGAALILSRGEGVTRVTPDGQILRIKSLDDVNGSQAAPADPKREKVGRVIDQLESLGIELAPIQELPENLSVTDVVEVARHNLKALKELRKDPDAALKMRSQLIDTLGKGEFVTVAFPSGSNGLGDQGVTLNGAQLERLLPFEAAPTPEMQQFKASFEALEKSGHVMLARGMAGLNAGMLSKADARIGYLTLAEGGEMVVLGPRGDLASLKKPDDLTTLLMAGKMPNQNAPTDPTKPKTNLFMLYFVSPFDPLEKGIYEDLPLRMSAVGSSDQMDMVTLRSDLPHKKNLRMDYIQKGELQELERLDAANTSMADPKTLEDFIYKSIKAHPGDQKIRLMVAGHGGAEKGLCPDGKDNNAAAHNAMPVDDFAGAIQGALDRIQQETGKRPVIDNLIVGSCLMGNTSFLHALASTGDVKALSASPEVLMGNDPASIFEYLNNPATANADALQYARDLVDTVHGQTAFPGGKRNLQFADTFGAYDLDKGKAEAFKGALDGFFKACLAHPDAAGYLKEDIWTSPSYGINSIYNTMMDVDDRDVIQVAERIQGDARVPKEIKDACATLIQAAADQVLVQKVADRYEGRKGATLYLPVDRFDYDDTMGKTGLLQSTDYQKFMDMIFDAPLHRGVIDNLFTQINRATEIARKEKKGQTEEEKELAKQREEMKKKFLESTKPMRERAALKALEEPPEMSAPAKVFRTLGQTIRTVCMVAGAIAGGAVGAVIGAPVGLLLGAKAGFSG
ncbi:MAG: hypothetical protein AB1758_27315, partial [Candidatus Eremiobacterota bacterium]